MNLKYLKFFIAVRTGFKNIWLMFRLTFFFVVLLLVFGLFIVSCTEINMETNQTRLFQTAGRPEMELAVNEAWSLYRGGARHEALNMFASILASGDEEFISSESKNTGLRCGFGYCLLACGRIDEALYQFEFDSDSLIESAAGAACVYLYKREYARCITCFKAFDRLFYQSSPYAGRFGVCGDINSEAHKILFLAYYYMPLDPMGPANMKIQYSFINEAVSSSGISPQADEIFLKIINAEAKTN